MRTFFLAEKAALIYCVGLGLLTMEMAVLSLIGIKFSVFSLSVCIVPIIAAAVLIPPRRWDSPKPFSVIEKFFIGAIAFEVLYAFFRTLIMPMEGYDAIAIYALKAKIFYLAGAIPHDFLTALKGFVPHIEYPLLIPLAETSFYTFLGSLNDLAVKVIFPLYYLSLLVVFYSVLKRFLNRKQSLLFTFLLATLPQVTDFATNGYADLPFAFYCSSAIFYLYLWMREKQKSFIILSFILSILAMWTKTEGLIFALINAVIAVIYSVKERSSATMGYAYAALSVLMVGAYLFIGRSLGLAVNSDFVSSKASILTRLTTGFERIPAILYEYQIQFFGPKRWNLIWILFIAGLIIGFRKIFSKNLMPVTASIILVLLGYTGVYMISCSPQGIGWHLSTSGSRLFLHFVPLVALWLALMFKELNLDL